MFLTLFVLQVLTTGPAGDPFAFLQPSVRVAADDRRQLDRGEPLARILPARGREVAVFAAMRVDIDSTRLVAWTRRIDELKKTAYVVAIGKFSPTPAIDDLAGLSLDDDELSEVRRCRPGKCGLKLSSGEMIQLRRAAAEGGPEWKSSVQHAFRLVVLQRVRSYLAEGRSVLPPYEDRGGKTVPASSFASILGNSAFLTTHLARFADHLGSYPKAASPDVESFVYWSKERVAGKPIVSATHVNILHGSERGLPGTLVAGGQIFATHYVNGSLGVTALVPGSSAGTGYLVYVNRSELDMLGGMFGGMVRWVMQRRLTGEAGDVLRALKRRLESGEPPAAASAHSDGAAHAAGSGTRKVKVAPWPSPALSARIVP